MKINFQKVAMDALIVGATGVAAHIAAEAIDLQKPEYADYGMIAVGVVLPEVVKGPTMDTVGNALTAVGAYRLAERYNLAGKLGFNTTPTPSTPDLGRIPGLHTIGSNWQSARQVYASAPREKKNPNNVNTVQ